MTDSSSVAHRCIKCHKLLAKGEIDSPHIEIKCGRCKHINFFFEKDPDQVVITDKEGKILYVNQSMEKVTGFLVDEMIGQTPALWGKQMPTDFYKDMWDKIKNKKELLITEIKNKKKDGTFYTAKLRISPILDKDGKVEFFIGTETVLQMSQKK